MTIIKFSKSFLYKEYIKQCKSMKQIAKETNCSVGTIRRSLIKVQISIRTVSEAKTQHCNIICDNCKQVFHSKQNVLKKNKHNFCSRKCYYIFKSAYYKGCKSPSWRGGYVADTCSFCNKNLLVPKWKKLKKYKFCTRNCMYKWLSKKHTGKGHPQYLHGKSYERYSGLFKTNLKNIIKKRDEAICQICKISELQHKQIYHQTLHVHHIDYNKQNCSENNLISLCLLCHIKTNFNRDYWYAYFTDKIKDLFKKETKE